MLYSLIHNLLQISSDIHLYQLRILSIGVNAIGEEDEC
jgi:hypothetical protein